MQIEKRLISHYKRWNIEFNYQESFSKFKNRLIYFLDKSVGEYLTLNSDVDNRFFEIFNLDKADKPRVKTSKIVLSIELASERYLDGVYSRTERGFGDTYVYKCIDSCETLQELAKVIQILFWALEVKYDETQNMTSKIVGEIKRLSVLTPSTSFAVHRRGRQVIVYPAGDQFLDRGIIDCTLSGLEMYPEVAKHFEKALEIYLHGETTQYRNLLDDLRFSLEQLLMKILSNRKSLEKQTECLLKWLNARGLHNQVINLYRQLLDAYRHYQNNAVKHNEDFCLDEIEFMIYLTGSFMRLLLQLAERNDNSRP